MLRHARRVSDLAEEQSLPSRTVAYVLVFSASMKQFASGALIEHCRQMAAEASNRRY